MYLPERVEVKMSFFSLCCRQDEKNCTRQSSSNTGYHSNDTDQMQYEYSGVLIEINLPTRVDKVLEMKKIKIRTPAFYKFVAPESCMSQVAFEWLINFSRAVFCIYEVGFRLM